MIDRDMQAVGRDDYGNLPTALDDAQLRELARAIRVESVRMIHRARSSHLGSCLSMADIMAVLYGCIMRFRPADPTWADRDRLIVSKGHAAAATYATLAEAGFMPRKRLEEFGRDSSVFAGHVTHGVPGVEVSTGSLGHGLPIATGMALAARRSRAAWRVFAVLSDGELDEGSNWEAFMFAAHHGLDNLTAVIDYNGIQSLDTVEKTLRLEPLRAKLESFGWRVLDVDGHDVRALRQALDRATASTGRPTAVIARTIKGKGVRFMEGKVLWHYRPPDDAEMAAAVDELGAGE